MLATLLGGSGLLLNFSHVAFAAIGAGLAWWAKQPPAPTLAAAGVPAAHVSTISSILEAIQADPTVAQVVQLVLARFAQQQTVAAHAALASVAVPIAVPTAPVVVVAPVVAK